MSLLLKAQAVSILLLGLVAFRVGKKLEYDGKAGKITNIAEANKYLTKDYRNDWVMDG